MENSIENRVLISISREYGSGGHDIGRELAKRLGINLYDAELLKKTCEEYGYDYDEWKSFEETPRIPLLSRSFGDFSSVPQDHVAEMEFRFIEEKIDSGESFVIVGRCGAKIIKNYNCSLRVFIWAEDDFRVDRIMNRHNVDEAQAWHMIKKKDRGRRLYTERFVGGKWDDPRGYDLFINSGKLGIDCVVDILENHIRNKML